MIVWLASWPRSGNTLLRITLRRLFDIETFSVYDDTTDIGAHAAAARLVGHRSHGQSREEFVARATMSEGTFYVKTHELPTDDAPALYMVRDGRSAIVSQWHYARTFWEDVPTLEDVLRGDSWAGSWSAHVRAWALSGRPRTLVLRYEDLVVGREETLDALAGFIGRAPLAPFDISFAELHAVYPEFFRGGSNERNLRELPPELDSLFNDLHGDAFKVLGYG